MKFSFVYITAKNKKEAKKIGKALLKARLAACVNIITNMNSLYRWKGKIQDDNEAILIAKTRKSLEAKLIKKVKAIHSYVCPCIITLPVLNGNKEFLNWLQEETRL